MTDRKLIIDTPFWKDLYAGEDPAFDPERASDLFAQIPEFARLANFTAEELDPPPSPIFRIFLCAQSWAGRYAGPLPQAKESSW